MNVKHALIHSLWIAHKDLLEFTRNRVMLVMLFVFPLFMMMMTGYIFPSGSSVNQMQVAVVNGDSFNGTTGPESLQFIGTINAVNGHTHLFAFSNLSSEDSARQKITRGEISGALLIAENFTSNLQTGQQGYMTVLIDQSNPQIAQQLTGILDKVIEQIGTTRAQYSVNRTTGYDLNISKAMVTPYNVKNKGTVAGNPSYFEFLAPGMMMMVVMFAVMTGLPRAISHEKEAGTFDGVLVAPTSRFSIIMGKTIAQSVRGVIQGVIVLILALALFGVTVNGSILLVVFLLLLGIFSFIGLGIVITSAAADEETASTIMMVLQFPMMFLSGVFFPIQQMPWYMQYISKALPLTYAIQAMRKVVVLGAGPGDIMLEIGVLLVFGIVLLAVSIPLFKKAMAR
jgi:ABC-2 type transport system permease protein